MLSLKRTDLLNIPVPSDTSTYKATPCKYIFETLDSLASARGWALQGEYLATKAGGQQQLIRSMYTSNNPLFYFEVATLNSYNKTIALKCAAGVSVRVCFNGMVTGEYKVRHKHQGDVNENLFDFLESAFDEKDKLVEEASRLWDDMNTTNLSPNLRHEIIGELFMEDLLNTNQVNIVKTQIQGNVQYDLCNEDSLNLFYQHVTYAQRNTHPLVYDKVRTQTEQYFKQLV